MDSLKKAKLFKYTVNKLSELYHEIVIPDDYYYDDLHVDTSGICHQPETSNKIYNTEGDGWFILQDTKRMRQFNTSLSYVFKIVSNLTGLIFPACAVDLVDQLP